MGITRSKQKTKDNLKLLIQEFNSRLQISLIGCYQAKKTFITLSDLWFECRGDVLETLGTVADQLDRRHRILNLASLTGITSSIAGGTAGIGGLLLAPVSGGVSLALSAGGLVGTVAGSATTLGASITEVYLTKELTERASKALETDAFYTRSLRAAFREIVLHEQEVLCTLSELKNEELLQDLEKVLQFTPCCDEIKKRFLHLDEEGSNSLEDILVLVKSLYPEDYEFLSQLNKTENMFKEVPTLSSTVSSSSEFFQAMKELAANGPETLKSISGTALQGTAVTSAQAASLTTQVFTVGLGAIFIALDIYQFMETARNYDKGSKTKLASEMRSIAGEMAKEKQQIQKLNDFYRQQIHVDVMNNSC